MDEVARQRNQEHEQEEYSPGQGKRSMMMLCYSVLYFTSERLHYVPRTSKTILRIAFETTEYRCLPVSIEIGYMRAGGCWCFFQAFQCRSQRRITHEWSY